MKTHFLLIAFTFIGLASAAAFSHVPAGLVIQSHRPETFSVMLDRQFLATRVNAFRFSGVVPGRHRVKIVYDCFAYNFDLHQDVLYDSWMDFHAGETKTLDVQPNGLVYVTSFIAPVAPHRPAPRPVMLPKPAPACVTPAYDEYNGYGYPAPSPVHYGMAPDAFFSLKQAVINRSFDSTKRELLASALRNNRVTAAQLYELLSLLDFESSKVEIAKIGFGSVVDRENFYRVYDALSFDSSIRELQRFIG